MTRVNDWAARAARYIINDFDTTQPPTEERIAAIIEIYARPLLDVLRAVESMGHHHCPVEQGHYCCPRCNCPDHGMEEGEVIDPERECDCGLEQLQQRFQKAINGPDETLWP